MSQAKGMSELDLEIAAVKFLLESFAIAENEVSRNNILRENFGVPYLKTYFGFSKEILQNILLQLQKKKEHLLQL